MTTNKLASALASVLQLAGEPEWGFHAVLIDSKGFVSHRLVEEKVPQFDVPFQLINTITPGLGISPEVNTQTVSFRYIEEHGDVLIYREGP